MVRNFKFSIIIPTYNRPNILRETLKYVENQTYRNFEVLVCSDGYSKDDENVVNEFDNKFKYFYIERIEKQFGNKQRTEMMYQASGDYFLWLDDDNKIYNNCLEVINNSLDYNDGILINNIKHDEVGIIPKENVLEYYKIDTLNFVVRKDIAKKFKWPNEYWADYLFIKDCEKYCIDNNINIKYDNNLIGEHPSKIINQGNKVIVLVLSTKNSHFKYMDELVKNTWAKYNIDNIEVIFYYADPNLESNYKFTGNELYIKCEETQNNILYKTLKALEFVYNNFEFDFIFRTNISSFVNQYKLYEYLKDKPKEKFYRGPSYVYDIYGDYFKLKYASGGGFFLSKDLVLNLLKEEHYPPLADDVVIGYYLNKYLIDDFDKIDITFDKKLDSNKENKILSTFHFYHWYKYFTKFYKENLREGIEWVYKDFNYLSKLVYGNETSIREIREINNTMNLIEPINNEIEHNYKISIFTPTHNPYLLDRLRDTILEQTYDNWEWVIVLNGDANVNYENDKIKIIRFDGEVGNIGMLKKFACENATGDVLLEVDHDDMLTEDALYEVNKAFQDSTIDFVYSNSADVNENWESHLFNSVFGWNYYDFEYKGRTLKVAKSSEPDPQSISRIWFAPNHLRAWRKEFYNKIGGHDISLNVADDHDLILRTYINGKMHHINKCLYIYWINGQNSWLKYVNEIQVKQWERYDTHIYDMANKWAKENNKQILEIGNHISKNPDAKTIGSKHCNIIYDLNERLPFEDDSIGVIYAIDSLQLYNDPLHLMNELWRVLAHGGFLFIEVPSTDGQGAFSNPRHKSFWNERSFKYYTDRWYRHTLEPECYARFLDVRTDTINRYDNVPFVRSHLIAIKNDSYRFFGQYKI